MSDTKDPVLSGTMIAGLLAIIALLVIRLPATLPPRPALPAGITLPDGARPEAVTLGRGWVAVVTDRDEIVMPYRTDVFWTQRRTEGPDQAPATSV